MKLFSPHFAIALFICTSLICSLSILNQKIYHTYFPVGMHLIPLIFALNYILAFIPITLFRGKEPIKIFTLILPARIILIAILISTLVMSTSISIPYTLVLALTCFMVFQIAEIKAVSSLPTGK